MHDGYRTWSKAKLVERLASLEQYHLQSQALVDRDRETAQDALRDSEERLRAIWQTAVEGIVTIDERGRIESMNPAAERIFGYAAAELIGKNVKVLMPAPYRENHDGYLDNYKRSGHAKIIGIGREVVGQRKDGTTFPMDLSVSQVKLHDKMIFTGFVRDITDRKRLEKEILQISELEQHRIGQDLHDGICQHMTAIELMAEVLETKLAKQAKSLAPDAEKIARETREVISQTRALSRGLSPVLLESEGLMSALKELASNTHDIFRISCQFFCLKPVLIDDLTTATHLYRIAQEAVSNAIKHGKAHEIQIVLSLEGGTLTLAIQDDGVGIQSPATKKKGMGLQVMKYRAGIIGGSVEVRKSDNGTRVICTINR
ncbi:MAG: Multi-sensor signal transduction histidine kinase [Verrucomicrobiales bacterium]|nr:Multi-sensor signal transduction histidine kinase [Verrucomicrobiales bacterium]